MSSLIGGKGMGDKIPKGYKQGQMQQFTPEQMQLFQSMFSNVGPDSYLSKLAGGDEEMFNQMEAPALKQFGAMQDNLASRFSGMGTGGRNSSGFQNTMTSAAQDFAGQLQSKRQSLQQQALKDIMGMSNELLGQKPYEKFLYEKQQKEKTPWGKLIGGGLGALAGLPGGLMGVSAGMQTGSSLGSIFD